MVAKWLSNAMGFSRRNVPRQGELVELEHCTNTTTFKEALESGCWICNVAWKTDHSHAETDSSPDRVPKVFGSIDDDVLQLEFRARPERVLFAIDPQMNFISFHDEDEEQRAYRQELEDECAADTGQCTRCFYGSAGIGMERLPKFHSLKTAAAWLEDCRANHPECRNEKEVKQYFAASERPPGPLAVSVRILGRDEFGPGMGSSSTYAGKLIDLGSNQLSSDEWRLIEVGSEGMDHYTYTTLSHRWASYEPLLLNATTKARMLRGMPISEMPANYQDAVRTTKALGVRYLWIDTLCVFQDSELDIQEAACNMAVVYSGSVCNIAVMTTESSGMLNGQSPPSLPDSIMHCKYQSGLKYCIRILHDSVWHREVTTMPLYKRGWIAQEQILPSRQLLCGSSRLFWSCRTMTRYETGRHNGWEKNSSQGWADQMRLAQMLGPSNEWNSQNEFWFKFLDQYTKRDLTNNQDKLLAVSGIAKFLQSKTEGIYMAGLWESALPDTLLWEVDTSSSRASAVPTAYRAPSWSWASVEGDISYTPPGFAIAQYLEGWTQTKNGSAFGFVTPNAYIEVRGPLILLKRNSELSVDAAFSMPGYEDYPISVDLDNRPSFNEILPYYHLLIMDIEESHVKYGFRGLLLQRVRPSRSLGKNWCDVKSAILIDPGEAEEEYRKKPLGPNTYERIGLVRACKTQTFAEDGSLVERRPGGRSSKKSTLFGSMLQEIRIHKQYRPKSQRNHSSETFEERGLDSYWKDVVLI